MIDAGTAYKLRSETFKITDAELAFMKPWEQEALNELERNQYPPFGFEAWRMMDPPMTILKVTYPVPVITTVEKRHDDEPDHGEPVDRASRAYESYRSANTPAPEERVLGWL